jgi:hypothetical protein
VLQADEIPIGNAAQHGVFVITDWDSPIIVTIKFLIGFFYLLSGSGGSGLKKDRCHCKQGGYYNDHRTSDREDLLKFIIGKFAHQLSIVG